MMLRTIAVLLVLACAGCVSDPAGPFKVGGGYQIRMAHDPNVAQVRVAEINGSWMHLQYMRNSPRLEPLLEEAWVNADQIVYWVDYE